MDRDKLKQEFMEDEIELENAEELDQMEYSEGEETYSFKEVRVTKKDFSIFELQRKYKNKKLILDVPFQRKDVWKDKQKCELIESILMGLPLPIFYFKQLDDSTYVVVDGKQRLSALFEYLDNKFALKNLKILKGLDDMKFKDLVDEFGVYQSQLEDYQAYTHVILPPTPDKILFDIFDRVNRGGTKLNKQEIRNALYQGRGMDMILEIAKGGAFENATRVEYEMDSRMKGTYLLTRFLAFYLYFTRGFKVEGGPYRYNGDSDGLVELSLKYLNTCSETELSDLKDKIEAALDRANYYLGRIAFRKTESNPINMNLFETTLFLMMQIEKKDERIKAVLRNRLYDIIDSEEFMSCIGNGRDNSANVFKRFHLVEALAEEV